MQEIRKLPYYGRGGWRQSATDRWMEVVDPSTGACIAQAPAICAAELEDVIAQAAEAFGPWSRTPALKRTQVLYRFRTLILEHMDELARLLARENGKTLEEARGDLLKVKEPLELACGAPSLLMGESLMDASRGYDTVLYREPVGVFAGIAPFNFPAMIPMGWMVPLCIAAGNTIVVKASSTTPMTAMRLLELLEEAGLPQGVVSVITADRGTAQLLLTDSRIKGVCFVGTTGAGLKIYAAAAANGKRVQALCEAKNHALVLEDAPVERTRVLAGRLKVGCAYDESAQMGPVVTKKHMESVLRWIETGVQEGAKLVLDGRDIRVPGFENGFYIGPTIFDRVTEEMTVGQREIFGPVLCIKRVKTFEEGVALINRNPYANGAVIYTQSGYYARHFARQIDGGMVGVNVGIPVPVGLFPFSGHKQSFFGDLHTLGKDGLRFFTETKVVTSTWFDEASNHEKVNTWDGAIG